jgi:hypothetical protein
MSTKKSSWLSSVIVEYMIMCTIWLKYPELDSQINALRALFNPEAYHKQRRIQTSMVFLMLRDEHFRLLIYSNCQGIYLLLGNKNILFVK